ncbi:6-carboxytetrahydropterin synthase [Sphingobacteriales bacterium CHB3]|nr:6-carboxytetrahydropterin synthase [Sphingobacteriales bacterium CHB3]
MVYITRKEHFSASHRLYNPDWSDDKNWEVYGKCNNPNGHGHNYEIEVTVAGNPPKETGMVIDLKKLSDIITKEIIDVVDHKHLNCDVDFMTGVIPTAENMAVEFWKILETKITGGRLYSIKLYESPNNFVEYRGE